MNTINLGEIAVCSEAVILPLTADVTGLWAFVSHFNGAYQYRQFQATGGQPLTVPAHLNENYQYNIKLYKPDSSLFNDAVYQVKTIPMLPEVIYDCTPTGETDLQITTGRKQFVAGEEQAIFADGSFVNARQVMVFVEGALRQQGTGEDEYAFDSSTGTITFNTATIAEQKITILYIK